MAPKYDSVNRIIRSSTFIILSDTGDDAFGDEFLFAC